MYFLLTQVFAIMILLLISANLFLSSLILFKILVHMDKADTLKRRLFPFISWAEK
jgi:hypothetical protein